MRPLAVLTVGALVGVAPAGCGDGRDPARAAQTATASPSETPAGTPAAPPRRRAVRLTVATGGDLLAHMPVVARARALAGGGSGYDFAPLLRELRPLVRAADLALCHVETPLVPGPPAGYPVFRTPPALARAIRATGWDACSTASNHTVDAGQAGIDSTLRALDAARVRHAGSYASRARRRPLILRARGVRVAFLAYTTSTNGIPPPHRWSVDLADPRRILRDARRARRAGAQAVMINMHWGTEFSHAPDAQQRRLAARLMRSRAITAIVGQHAHVVQPIRRVRGRWVVFGAGNLLSNQSSACCPAATQDGMVAILHLRIRGKRARVERIRYAPTWVRHPDYAVVRAGRESWRRTVRIVGRGGGLRPLPARPPR